MSLIDIKSQKKMYAGGISASLVAALFKGVNVFTDLGRYFGSSLRRLTTRNICR
ncbi:MAG: hypothetical protein IKP98_03340 [Bacilli bacterium]|nr:hypothetical protein [Bacilli bacterium]